MLTFKKFHRDDKAKKEYEREVDFYGWEQTIHVFKGDSFLCQINTAQAYCCGFNTMEKVSSLTLLSSEEISTFWKEVGVFLGAYGGDYNTDFRVGELFCLHNSGFMESLFYKESKGEIVHSYRSKSEPNHLTYLYKFNLCSS